MSALPVLTSCRSIVEQSRFVQVDSAAVGRFLNSLSRSAIPPLPLGPAAYHYFNGTGRTAQWLFVLDTLNHCFWPDPDSPRWQIQYQGETLSGYWALAASLKRALEEGIPIHRAHKLAHLNPQTLAHLFRGTGRIPLFRERLENLREAGRVLVDRFQGNFLHVLEEAAGSAVRLVLLLASEFSSFNDVAVYNGHTVYFLKRAQLLAMDLWSTFSGTSWGRLEGLDQLSAFADYKLPQVLRHVEILRFSQELASTVDAGLELPAGSPEEVEIRAATVWAVELLRQELQGRGQVAISAQLDHWLWTLGQQDEYRTLPYHRTRTIFY